MRSVLVTLACGALVVAVWPSAPSLDAATVHAKAASALSRYRGVRAASRLLGVGVVAGVAAPPPLPQPPPPPKRKMVFKPLTEAARAERAERAAAAAAALADDDAPVPVDDDARSIISEDVEVRTRGDARWRQGGINQKAARGLYSPRTGAMEKIGVYILHWRFDGAFNETNTHRHCETKGTLQKELEALWLARGLSKPVGSSTWKKDRLKAEVALLTAQ